LIKIRGHYAPNIRFGFLRIQAAVNIYKNLESRIAIEEIYDASKSGEFWQDNVGITPLILQNLSARNFDFNIVFVSVDSQRQ
jgi:hypothetical protein